MKTKKAAQIHAQMKDTIAKKKAQLDKMIQQRRLMQARLKDIYMRNQRKKVSQKYREQPPSFDSPASSSGVSSGSKDSNGFSFSKNSNSKAKSHPLALYSTNFFSGEPTDKESNTGSAMFGSTSSKKSQHQQRRQSTNERSQANRSPFFA